MDKIPIKIYSCVENTPVISVVKQIGYNNIFLEIKNPEDLHVNPNEIIIVELDNIDSTIVRKLSENHFPNQIIFIIQNNDGLLLSSIVKLGFHNIFCLPFETYKLISFLQEIIENKKYKTIISENDELYKFSWDSIIGTSKEIVNVKELARKVSEKTNANILILGETGTGKGLFARAIHQNSPKRNSPFVDIICSAIPENLLESELFGYEPGAFTNALSLKYGLFELAENGTLFLDEIGDLSQNIQAKLLRAIEKKIIRRLGGLEDIPIEAGIISATNRNLEIMINTNQFRRDLFHRLNVVSLELPPLRVRGRDILLLAKYFIKEFNLQFNKSIKSFDKDVEELLLNYKWPGNIRELKNAMERAVLLSDNSKLKLKHFYTLINSIPIKDINIRELSEFHPHRVSMHLNYESTNLRKLNKIYAKEVLDKMKGNKSQTSKILGISRPKLDSLLK